MNASISPSNPRFRESELTRFVAQCLAKLGIPTADANSIGALMAQAEMQGSDGHGMSRLIPYARRIRAGGMNLQPTICVEHERAGMALVNGDNGMGHLVMKFATELAIAKAKTAGVAWVSAHHSNHAGPASLYARMPLAHDMIGLYFAVGNANHLPPWGGLEMLLSTNPLAVAVPTLNEPPVVLDMATTVAAYGKVKSKAARGEMMPEGWMIDRQGKPLLDPKRAEEGFLLPIGGYKGYGLALIVGLLAGSLGGAAMGREVIDFNKDDKTTTNTGQSILVIDPAAFGEVAAFKARVDVVVRDLRESERMPGVERIWLPGEQSHWKRSNHVEHGVSLAPTLVTQLENFARELNVDVLNSAA